MNTRWDEYFVPDFNAGILTWKLRDESTGNPSDKRWNKQLAGKIAGTLNDRGYRVVCIGGRLYKAHRILWEMAHGAIPYGMQIDHRDRSRSNNRLSNLRLATHAENRRNSGMQSNNISGVKGVGYNKDTGKWIARVGKKYLGLFITFEEACDARKAEEVKLHGEFASIANTLHNG